MADDQDNRLSEMGVLQGWRGNEENTGPRLPGRGSRRPIPIPRSRKERPIRERFRVFTRDGGRPFPCVEGPGHKDQNNRGRENPAPCT
ncbi:MAG TPA: hypothetical protein VIU33_04175 [Nitrospiria bacterium]